MRFDIPKTAGEYKFQTGMKIINYPIIDRVILAHNSIDIPFIYAIRILNENREYRWIVSNDSNGRSYMFKDDGLFGKTDTYSDKYYNSFASSEEAISAFQDFYH